MRYGLVLSPAKPLRERLGKAYMRSRHENAYSHTGRIRQPWPRRHCLDAEDHGPIPTKHISEHQIYLHERKQLPIMLVI
jgi:hypothetical protein